LKILKAIQHFFKTNPWRYFLYQFLFLAFILQLGRLIWFVGNAYWLQPLGLWAYVKVFIIGFYFDLPVLAYAFAPLWLWWAIHPKSIHDNNRLFRLLATCLTFGTVLLNAIDAGYSNVTSKRSGKELWDVLLDPANKISVYLLDYWWGLLLVLLSGWLIWKLYPLSANEEKASSAEKSTRIQSGSSHHARLAISTRFVRSALNVPIRLIFIAGLILFLGRGGTRLRPLRASDAAEFVHPEISALLISTPFNIISSLQSSELTLVQWQPPAILNSQIKGSSKPLFHVKLGGKPSVNVVLIVVESLARDYTGFLNGAPYTPFLDKLAKNPDAVVFPYCFANGTKSIEMAPSIFLGMPNLMEDFFITSTYSTNKLTNVFGWLRKQNYTTQFFHGSNNGTMGFRSFFKHGGLDEYYGINEYPNASSDFDGHWGIYDEPYLQYACNQLSQNKQPFFSSIFTLSSHHPYAIPKHLENRFPGSNQTVQKTIAYADYSLEKFFQTASKQAWFNNTVFIITGDHTSHGTLGYFYSPSGHYEIPLMIFAPGRGKQWKTAIPSETIQKTCSQLDIIPTSLAMIWNEPKVRLGMGRSLLDSSYQGYSYHYDKGFYYIIQYPFVLVMDAHGSCVEYYKQLRNSNKKEDLLISNHPTIAAKKAELLVQLQSCLQVYRTSLKQNNWDDFFNH